MTHVLIAGAGIGGLTAALGLSRMGIAVTLLERAGDFSEVGAGLQISPNASAILRRLGVLDAVRKQATAPRAIRVRDGRSAATLSLMPLEGAEARWGAPYLVIHRADLQRALVDAVVREPGIALHRGTALAGFGTTTGGVTVTAKQDRLTRSFTADALIGADGVHSIVRARLVDRVGDEPTETGRTAWRALLPAEALADAPTSETGLWLGRDAHLVHYPLRGGAFINVVAVLRETGPSARSAPSWALPGDPAAIARRFAKWHAVARGLIAAAPSWQCWPLFDRAPLKAWNAGTVALLGDAAHPILPFLAQGAAQAIEDAEALAEALAGPGPMSACLARYSTHRLARAVRVQAEARRLGRIYHLAGPAALARNLAMRGLGARRLLQRYDWLYGSAATPRSEA